MDVHIQELTSDVHVADARAMLAPEVMDQIIAAVLRALREQELENQNRRHDMQIDRRALPLD